MQSRSAEERRAELVELYREAAACERCPLFKTRTKVVFGSGNADAGPHVRRRGARHARGPAGPSVRGAGRAAPQQAARGDRARARGRVHRERAPVAAARQPRPPARRDRRLPAVPPPQDRADRAEGDLHARQLRDEAAHPLAARDHGRARAPAGARARAAACCASTRSSTRRRRCAAPRRSRTCARTSRGCPRCSRSRRRCRSARWRRWPQRQPQRRRSGRRLRRRCSTEEGRAAAGRG